MECGQTIAGVSGLGTAPEVKLLAFWLLALILLPANNTTDKMVRIKLEPGLKVLRTGAAAPINPCAVESARGSHTDTCLQPDYRERDRDHARGSRDRSRSPVDRERSYRDRDDRERSNGAYNDRNNTRTDGAMDDRQQNSQQDRRVYVGNLAYDVKWHHLKDFMREGTHFRSLQTSPPHAH